QFGNSEVEIEYHLYNYRLTGNGGQQADNGNNDINESNVDMDKMDNINNDINKDNNDSSYELSEDDDDSTAQNGMSPPDYIQRIVGFVPHSDYEQIKVLLDEC
ncbi:hypothetical protein EV175_005981, partial [Coemansia sp. RSA 1933]